MNAEPVSIDDLCSHIRSSEQALTAHHEAVLRRYGLAMTQYLVLLALSREGGMSAAQLARVCGVTQQSMASVLSGLQGKGLIRRDPSPMHAKVQVATLTSEGEAVFQQAYGEVAVLERHLAEAFSPKERASLIALLERARAVLVAQTAAAPRDRSGPQGR
jgi:DNA-binding MarR family transcriptional regulator